MKNYTGTKIVNAMSMSRLSYNALRKWTLPEGEDGSDEGYLIEYTDGGTPNHADFAGYISWSPKEQFEKVYKENIMHNLTSPPTNVASNTAAFATMASILNGANTAPRITEKDVQAAIASEHYFTAEQGVKGATHLIHVNSLVPLSLLTFCVLTLRNGYTVVGQSAYVSAANFNATTGQEIARRNAEAQVWPLLSYALKDNLYEYSRHPAPTSSPPSP